MILEEITCPLDLAFYIYKTETITISRVLGIMQGGGKRTIMLIKLLLETTVC